MQVNLRLIAYSIGLILLAVWGMAIRPAKEASALAGPSLPLQRIENFELLDSRGETRSLADFSDKRLIVVAFLGTECPLAKLYAPRLSKLAKQFSEHEVQFLGINSNQQDSLTDVAAYASMHRLTFPMLKDPDSRVADRFGAQRTPEVFVLDETRTVRYQGRIDDQYAIGIKRNEPRRRDLAIAITQLLDGVAVATPKTTSVGCLIGRQPHEEQFDAVTYRDHVFPILQRRCVTCHQPTQAAPFALTHYSDVVGWSAMIREVVSESRMPPWFANPEHGEFKNDARLDESERELLIQWIDEGCPLGSSMPPDATVVKESGWQIPEPDLVLPVQQEPSRIPAEGEIAYQYFVIDPGFQEDMYIKAVEVRPGNAKVVHHAMISIADPNDPSLGVGNCGILINYAPGMQPTILSDGEAIRIPAGQKFVAQMHYTPIGTEQFDQTQIGFVFGDEKEAVRYVSGSAIVNTTIRIPAHASDHRETARTTLQEEVALRSVSPHMHLRGKAFRYEALYPDGTKEILLDVPRYDFNWQLRYIFQEPKLLPRGTTLTCTATYDNSSANPANPKPAATVTWGDQTHDEMLIGFYTFVRAAENSGPNFDP